MPVIKWTEIESFAHIRKHYINYPELCRGNPSVTYRAKVKLHGNNAGIQVHDNGTLVAQSRTMELSLSNDLAGFAKSVDDMSTLFEKYFIKSRGLILFGEWCGPGIQSGVAVTKIDKKIFALFAARSLNSEDDRLIIEPEELHDIFDNLVLDEVNIYILPWHNEPIVLDWSASDEELLSKTATINEWVSSVEKCDPWVKDTFNVEGTGEGLVFYPVSKDHTGYENYCNLVFKAKGAKHRVIETKTPVAINVEIVENSNQFADMVLTLARLEQGVRAIADGNFTFDVKSTGKFLAWILSDVEKETKFELAESGLEWKQVQKVVGDKARLWYLTMTKK